MHLDPPPVRCGACDAPAVIRFAIVAPDELPAAALARRPQYRCPSCSPLRSPDWIANARTDALDWLVVVDPAFTRELLDPRCGCGLPADHRDPLSGEPRGCLDETARIALPSARPRPPVHARVLSFLKADRAWPEVEDEDQADDDATPVRMLGDIYIPRHTADAIDPDRKLRAPEDDQGLGIVCPTCGRRGTCDPGTCLA